jgi:hypothetical protein
VVLNSVLCRRLAVTNTSNFILAATKELDLFGAKSAQKPGLKQLLWNAPPD